MATKVPAWKRLGLKLKPGGGASGSSTALQDSNSSPPTTQFGSPQPANKSGPSLSSTPSSSALGKRKQPGGGPPASEPGFKFARRQDSFTPRTPAASETRKRVSLSTGTRDAPSRTPIPKTPHPGKKAPAAKTPDKSQELKEEPPRDPPNLGPSFEYLRRWRDSRDSWRFNKNNQTLLIKYIFHDEAVPASELDTFYRYIRDLKGFVRSRLQETATDVRNKDIAGKAKGFAEGVKNAEGKQDKYEEIVKDYTPPSGQPKHYVEAKFLDQGIDKFIAKRVVRRMRAERILQELAETQDQDQDQDTTPSMTNADSGAAEDAGADAKRINLDNGRRAARPRKTRHTADHDSSSGDESGSDESGGEGNSDSSSSSGGSDHET